MSGLTYKALADDAGILPNQIAGLYDPGQAFGKTWYVNSNHARAGTSGLHGSIRYPFQSLAAAMSYVASGDTILLAPGHGETIASATGCVVAESGLKIIGVGYGSQIPTLTLTTAAGATLSITGANNLIRNIKVYSNYTNGVTAGITVGADADGLVLDGVKWAEAANTKEFLIGLSLADGASDVTVMNCEYEGLAGGSTTSFVSALGAADGLKFIKNVLHGECSAAAVKLDAAASARITILDNIVVNLNTSAGLGIAIHNSTTGRANNNHIINLNDGVAGITGNGMAYGRNYYSNLLAKSTRLVPAEDS